MQTSYMSHFIQSHAMEQITKNTEILVASTSFYMQLACYDSFYNSTYICRNYVFLDFLKTHQKVIKTKVSVVQLHLYSSNLTELFVDSI